MPEASKLTKEAVRYCKAQHTKGLMTATKRLMGKEGICSVCQRPVVM